MDNEVSLRCLIRNLIEENCKNNASHKSNRNNNKRKKRTINKATAQSSLDNDCIDTKELEFLLKNKIPHAKTNLKHKTTSWNISNELKDFMVQTCITKREGSNWPKEILLFSNKRKICDSDETEIEQINFSQYPDCRYCDVKQNHCTNRKSTRHCQQRHPRCKRELEKCNKMIGHDFPVNTNTGCTTYLSEHELPKHNHCLYKDAVIENNCKKVKDNPALKISKCSQINLKLFDENRGHKSLTIISCPKHKLPVTCGDTKPLCPLCNNYEYPCKKLMHVKDSIERLKQTGNVMHCRPSKSEIGKKCSREILAMDYNRLCRHCQATSTSKNSLQYCSPNPKTYVCICTQTRSEDCVSSSQNVCREKNSSIQSEFSGNL